MEKSFVSRDPPFIAPAPTRTMAPSLSAGWPESGGTLFMGEVAVPVESENVASESSPKCSKWMLNTTSGMVIAPSLGKLPAPAPLYSAVIFPTKSAFPRTTSGNAEIRICRVSGKDSSTIESVKGAGFGVNLAGSKLGWSILTVTWPVNWINVTVDKMAQGPRRPPWGSPAAVYTTPSELVANKANRPHHGTAVTRAPGTPTKLSDTGAQAPIRPLWGSPPAVHTAPSELVANNANRPHQGTAVTRSPGAVTKLSDTSAQAPIRPLWGSPPAVHTAPSELVANNANRGPHRTAGDRAARKPTKLSD